MSSEHVTRSYVVKGGLVRIVSGILLMGLLFFLPAGTFDFWQAWLFILAAILLPMLLIFGYFFLVDPAFMARRFKMRESQSEQKWIVAGTLLPFLLGYILPGLDRRFGWSNVPLWLIIAAYVLIWLGYTVMFLSFRANRYAARVVEVMQGQTVTSTGPYAVIRHPYYLGALPMYILAPLALGSWWGMLPALLILPFIALRILNEEQVLARDLPGYAEYMQKTRWRLLPGVW